MVEVIRKDKSRYISELRALLPRTAEICTDGVPATFCKVLVVNKQINFVIFSFAPINLTTVRCVRFGSRVFLDNDTDNRRTTELRRRGIATTTSVKD